MSDGGFALKTTASALLKLLWPSFPSVAHTHMHTHPAVDSSTTQDHVVSNCVAKENAAVVYRSGVVTMGQWERVGAHGSHVPDIHSSNGSNPLATQAPAMAEERDTF